MRVKVAVTAAGCGLVAFCLLAAGQHSKSDELRLIRSVEGADLYRSYCAVCHGKEGRGDGPMVASLKARVPDLTRIAERNRGEFPVDRVREIITGDVELSAGHGTREMPIWGPVFSRVTWDQDLGPVRLQNLARYLEKLQAKEPVR